MLFPWITYLCGFWFRADEDNKDKKVESINTVKVLYTNVRSLVGGAELYCYHPRPQVADRGTAW